MIDVCIPIYQAVEVECFVSMMTARFPKGGINLIVHKGEPDIVKARNEIVSRLACELSLWVDADIMFPSLGPVTLFETMERLQADIVTGLYRGRTAPHEITCYLEYEDGKYRHNFESVSPIKFEYESYQLDACGAGFMLVRNSVFKKNEVSSDPSHLVNFTKIDGLSEDLSFCRKVKKYGGQIYADSRVKCGHVSQITLEV